MHKTGREKEDKTARRAKIRALNDAFRKTFWGGRVLMTAGVAALENPVRNAVVEKIKAFDAFDDDNDPWGEHDFVSVEHDGQTFFAKINYYDRKLEAHSEDAADPEKTCRVMTIMLAEEHRNALRPRFDGAFILGGWRTACAGRTRCTPLR